MLKKVEIKDRIRNAMDLRNLTQSELSEKAKIDKGQLSSYLSGKYKPRQKNIEAIAKTLNVDEAWLMGFDVPMERHVSSVKKDNNYFQTDAERKLILSYRKLNEKNQKKCSIYVNTLLTNQQLEEELLPNAAHERTDIEITDEMRQHDDDIMNDDSNWK